METAAWPERLLAAADLSSVLGAPVEAMDGSAVAGAAAAPRSCGVLFLELVAVVAAPVLHLGVRHPLRWMVALLLNLSRSLQVVRSPSVVAVGVMEEGRRCRLCLRRETAMAVWRQLEADVPSTSRFWCLRQMDPAAFQRGWSSWLAWCMASSPSSSPVACCWRLKMVCCSVDPRLLCVSSFFLLFVRVWSFSC